jgi:hypothetical protein
MVVGKSRTCKASVLRDIILGRLVAEPPRLSRIDTVVVRVWH